MKIRDGTCTFDNTPRSYTISVSPALANRCQCQLCNFSKSRARTERAVTISQLGISTSEATALTNFIVEIENLIRFFVAFFLVV